MKNLPLMSGFNTIYWWLAIVANFFGGHPVSPNTRIAQMFKRGPQVIPEVIQISPIVASAVWRGRTLRSLTGDISLDLVTPVKLELVLVLRTMLRNRLANAAECMQVDRRQRQQLQWRRCRRRRGDWRRSDAARVPLTVVSFVCDATAQRTYVERVRAR